MASGRGGRRRGAGAPRGNLNALKHGRHSKQLLALTDFLLSSDYYRAMTLKLHQERQRLGRLAPPGPLQTSANQMARRIMKKGQSNRNPPDSFEEPLKPIES